jgi:hypothetical protein
MSFKYQHPLCQLAMEELNIFNLNDSHLDNVVCSLFFGKVINWNLKLNSELIYLSFTFQQNNVFMCYDD